MRKLISIVFLVLFLMNISGYYVVFLLMDYHFEQQAISRLDANDTSDLELFEFHLNISLPYTSNKDHYERVDGLVEKDGIFYRLVKQRYAHDTLFIVCVRDDAQQRLDKAFDDYVKAFASTAENKSSDTDLFKAFSKDYWFPVEDHVTSLEEVGFWKTSTDRQTFSPIYLTIPSPPPKDRFL